MKYSYYWLQEHIDKPLLGAEELRRVVTTKAFEVEEMEMHDDNAVFDIKVLPDRAHDALSHRGMAREIAALCDLPRKERTPSVVTPNASVLDVRVSVEDPTLCMRYVGIRFDNIVVGSSPDWLVKKLESIGSRSINNIVDITNFILFDLGQPTHAFDAAKVVGGITVRLAKKGEKMMTLDNKDLELEGTELVITDDEGVLALAGVKGGKKAEVDAKTTSIIFEVANFQPTLTRRTSTRQGIKTDASKRYENGITSELADVALHHALPLFVEHGGTNVMVGKATDVYPKPETWIYKVGVSLRELNGLLGSIMTDADVKTILKRAGFVYEKVVVESALRAHIDETLGKSYKNPTSMREDAPMAFSCSSLVSYLYLQAGIFMPSLSVDKYAYGTPIEESDLRFGDLIFSNSGEGKIYKETVEYKTGTQVPEGVDHVGMYLDDGMVLHASKRVNGVVSEKIAESASFKNIVGYRRMVDDLKEERYVVSIPPERLDLRITEDLIEEIGRHYGYDNISSSLPALPRKGLPHKRLYYANVLRDFFVERGFSEVFTYSFAAKIPDVAVELANPVAKDKPFMRPGLTHGIRNALTTNNYNAALLGKDEIRIFEIGNVFPKAGEHTAFAFGIYSADKKKAKGIEEEAKKTLVELTQELGTPLSDGKTDLEPLGDLKYAPYVWEINFDQLLTELAEPEQYEPLHTTLSTDMRYRTLSIYPFIVRDIALFVPASVEERKLEEIIKTEAGSLLVRFSRFDKFQKPGEDRISYAYRLVFQSFDRTLTDDEVNGIMQKITSTLNVNEGWEVR